MSLANKTFKNNKTGDIVKVIDSFENIAILEGKQKIDVSILMNQNEYTEQIDPASFFSGQGSYNALAEKIKNIPTENIVDEDGSISINVGGGLQPATDESAVIMTTEEDEMAELARKYGVETDNTDAVSKQNEAFAKILGNDEDLPKTQPKTQIGVTEPDIHRVEVNRDQPAQRIQRSEDPIINMFKNVKRNVNFNISVDISDKIPRLDFIEMMEDSYETSIIDFLADEFTNKILSDPSLIRDTIKDKINQLVFGGAEAHFKRISKAVKPEAPKTKMFKEGEKPPHLKKPSVSERIKTILKLETIEEVESSLKGETAKTVKEAGSNRIKELGSKK